MNLATIFKKPIDRPIEGVIKADDEASLRLEVEEYVLTREVAKRLDTFLQAYNNYQGANGVWISGFFGSGKSHLLKMLALLLENRTLNGDAATLDLFLPKCGHNELLKADLSRAVAIPSQSILFNIDQKADVISKKEIDALLAVFVKVFDETCGYYGKQGHIAQFERELDQRDQYEPFQAAYQEIAGQSWVFGREQALLEAHNIAAAYAQVTGTPQADAVGIIDRYRATYKLSIEDFAEQVSTYIKQQEPDFRLNFFVDEVGQYIANNIKLMTNLQTIAESLATKCNGRSWIIVTAQEDMDSVTGEMGRQQANDFSKIQARFANRMKLTSADVAEVIKTRLLSKNEPGERLLATLYAQQQNNFRTLFDFVDGSQTYRNFRDQADFSHSYPFIPYQFTLFQSAIESLSLHNAFEGKHSSVGERSMLGVFQQVVVHIGTKQVGELATFDLMFEGIRTALKSQIQRAVINAEEHLVNPFAVQLLKALFLVKYVKEFKATPRNLAVLMLGSFETDLTALRKQLQAALDLLEQETYIQRNGEVYEYLTNEEKDVEEEIKHTPVETDAVIEELGKIIFDQILKQRKIRYDENGQDYPFTRKVDGRSLTGREYELSIHIISPFHEHAGNETLLRAQTMDRDELLVVMPANDRLVRDLMLYKRTEKYVRQNISVTPQTSVQRILRDKQETNGNRYRTLQKQVADLLAEATLIAGSYDVESNSSDAQTRLINGFHDLIVRTYTNLRMLRGVTYAEHDIGQYLQASPTLLGDQQANFSEAEQEMLAFVNDNNRRGLRTTIQTLVNRFERKPYGWYLAAIQGILAKLCGRGKIEIRRDSQLLEGHELAQALRNSRDFANLILEPQVDFTGGQVRQLRDFYADFFAEPPAANEAKALGRETQAAFASLLADLRQLEQQQAIYPFLSNLTAVITQLADLERQPYAFYLTDLSRREDALFDLKEQVIDPIRRFMGGNQRQIYDDARRFLDKQEANLSYVTPTAVSELRQTLNDPHCYQGRQMQTVKKLLDQLKAETQAQIEQIRTNTLARLEELRQQLAGMDEFAALTAQQQASLREAFAAIERTIKQQYLIAVIRDTLRRFEEQQYQQLISQTLAWAAPPPAPPDPDKPADHNPQKPQVAEPPITYEIVGRYDLRVSFPKPLLTDETDIEAYLQALRDSLVQAIREGKRIQV